VLLVVEDSLGVCGQEIFKVEEATSLFVSLIFDESFRVFRLDEVFGCGTISKQLKLL